MISSNSRSVMVSKSANVSIWKESEGTGVRHWVGSQQGQALCTSPPSCAQMGAHSGSVPESDLGVPGGGFSTKERGPYTGALRRRLGALENPQSGGLRETDGRSWWARAAGMWHPRTRPQAPGAAPACCLLAPRYQEKPGSKGEPMPPGLTPKPPGPETLLSSQHSLGHVQSRVRRHP